MQPVYPEEPELPQEFLVLPENWAVLSTFKRLQTQWNKTVVSGLNGSSVRYDGLDYMTVNLLFETYFSEHSKTEFFDRFQIVEAYAIQLLNETNHG